MFVKLNDFIVRVNEIDYVVIQTRNKYDIRTHEVGEVDTYSIIVIRKGEQEPLTVLRSPERAEIQQMFDYILRELNHANHS